jgi:hypothetical protein
VKFFYGVGNRPLQFADEVFVDAPDTYLGLPEKIQAVIRWARVRGYTHLFKCDDDAYLVPERLLTSGFESHSYIGDMTRGYAHGGAGYWLDISAMTEILLSCPEGKSEDGWVAGVLKRAGIIGHHDPRYQYTQRVYRDPLPESPSLANDIILAAEFTPEEIQKVHHRWAHPVDPTDAMSANEYKKYLREKRV